MTKEAVLSVLVLVFAVLMVSLALTGITLLSDAHKCSGNGGHFSIEGGTAWCRYR